ncbi:sulfurtransferase-like selenium metabolism protein YedF [Saccharicrinis sp. FJH54]|uniref:sulfurtransferase-like selenium metabolism protein YedF n=1 Tax=Saccharicrinis sp. FJH54 TaxID=3344665 RepID=UPI0035D44BD9
MKNFKNTLIQISHDGMGSGDDALGLQLITNYFKLMNEEDELPRFIVFYNSGVKLICKSSPVIDVAQALEQKGVKLMACKTCLKHYDLMDKTEVGIAGTMMDIIELQKIADKVITL